MLQSFIPLSDVASLRFAARFRAWPLAWPSPSGPPGRQRLQRSRVCACVASDATEGSALDAGGADPDNARRSGPVSWPFARRLEACRESCNNSKARAKARACLGTKARPNRQRSVGPRHGDRRVSEPGLSSVGGCATVGRQQIRDAWGGRRPASRTARGTRGSGSGVGQLGGALPPHQVTKLVTAE
jgi:hypothetical protein